MQRHVLCLIVSLGVVACQKAEPSPAANGGVYGLSGGAADGGASGHIKGGAGAAPASCPGAVPFATLLVHESGKIVDTSFSAHVTVISSEACDERCPSSVASDARIIVLEDSSQPGVDGARWSLIVRLDGLPDDLLALHESYDLTLTAEKEVPILVGGPLSQTVVFARDGALLLALAKKAALFVNPPDLSTFGLTLSRDEPECVAPGAGLFGVQQFKLRVNAGDESVLVGRGSSARLGELTLQLPEFDSAVDKNVSDQPERLSLGIYRAPQRSHATLGKCRWDVAAIGFKGQRRNAVPRILPGCL